MMSFTVMRRRHTPKGTPKDIQSWQVERENVLSTIAELLDSSCWVYAENNDVDFTGQNKKKV